MHDIHIAPKCENKIKSVLRSTKDTIPLEECSGIYEAMCATNNCSKKYIGQTTRALKTRRGEHLKDIEKIRGFKSGLAEHIIDEQHHIEEDNFKLIEREANYLRLNILESLHIHTNSNNVNRDVGPHHSSLFMLLKSKRRMR